VEGVVAMDVIHPRCAGVDISKRDAKVCVRIAGSGRRKTVSTVTTWGAVTNQVLALRDHLIAEAVTLVVMEATSDYWKPFFYLLEDGPFEVMLVNSRHVKNLPGRKTDVSDAAWLAQLGAPIGRSRVPPVAGQPHPSPMGNVPLRRLRTSDLDLWYAELRRKGALNGGPLAPNSVMRIHSVLRRALGQGVKWGWISMNPGRMRRRPARASKY
jgi:hypothetical protein